MPKLKVAILGATGAVGQRLVQLLDGHPWFETSVLAASERSASKRYVDACNWIVSADMPEAVRDLKVVYAEPGFECDVVLSALPTEQARATEEAFAHAGYIVSSNASPHRVDADVPLLLPDINAEHLDLIETQRAQRGWQGAIVCNPNCTSTPLTYVLKALNDAFEVQRCFVVSMQSLSGAGYPGVSSLDILDNVIPYIGGEEEKVEREPRKMLGKLTPKADAIEFAPFKLSAQCNRVQVWDGHLESISVELARKPSIEEVTEAFESYRGLPQKLGFPTAAKQPIMVRREHNRPQPRLDRLAGGGMATVVGRIRPCSLLDIKMSILGHNTIGGAAGAALLNAELLAAQGYLRFVPQPLGAKD